VDLPVNYEKTHFSKRRLVREEYIKIQGGKCYHCKSSLHEKPPMNIVMKRINKKLFPSGFFSNPVHLHHSHDTGMTIGAVHGYCNAILWQYHGE
jgi:hypothetical protein